MAKATRLSFGEALAEYGKGNPRVVVLDADLSKSTMTSLFAKVAPERFFQLGIAEANMIGVAAGLALSGKTAFCASFACFLVGRFETIRMSVAYSEAPVRLIGTHAGIGIGEDGYSQMALEDVALMRSLSGVAVLQPCDTAEARQMAKFLIDGDWRGPAYVRLTRQNLPDINSTDYAFQFGKGVVLRDGKDLTLIGTGATVAEALGAADLLDKEGISARVVNLHTIKPIDTELLVRCAKETGRIFTAEDHNVLGGMGSAVCEVLAEYCPTPVKRWGVLDRFGQSGTQKDLYRAYEIDAAGIAEHATAFVRNGA